MAEFKKSEPDALDHLVTGMIVLAGYTQANRSAQWGYQPAMRVGKRMSQAEIDAAYSVYFRWWEQFTDNEIEARDLN